MSETPAELVARLDAWLRANRGGYHRTLRPGASDGEIARLAARIGETLPPALVALYQWRDGQDDDCEIGFEFNRMFLPLEAVHVALDDLAAEHGAHAARSESARPRWRPRWLPWLGNGAGDYLMVDLEGAFADAGGVPGQVLQYWGDWQDRMILFPSVEAWLATLVTALEDGQLTDQAGDLEPRDEDRYDAFVSARNPGYPICVDADAPPPA